MLETKAVRDYVSVCMSKYSQYVEQMADQNCSLGQFHKVVDKVFGEAIIERKREELEQLFYGGAGNEGKTLYDAFNAITEFTSHRVRKNEKSQFQYVNFGSGRRLNEDAFRTLVTMAA